MLATTRGLAGKPSRPMSCGVGGGFPRVHRPTPRLRDGKMDTGTLQASAHSNTAHPTHAYYNRVVALVCVSVCLCCGCLEKEEECYCLLSNKSIEHAAQALAVLGLLAWCRAAATSTATTAALVIRQWELAAFRQGGSRRGRGRDNMCLLGLRVHDAAVVSLHGEQLSIRDLERVCDA